ncbi:hypothetical protein BKA62DRAFT_617163 [Auriculariales sp. MPI-PUGE-AT-0066]|nr:hypothetical protein BKA62DRAFT_617163 [Auriculariales sp. MPI-PUGE-AT-0066]
MKINRRRSDPEEAERLAAIDPSTIRLIANLVPGNLHDYGFLESKDTSDGRGPFTIDALVYPFGHAKCFLLLEAWVPPLMHPVGNFWATMRAQNGIFTREVQGVDYGDIQNAMLQYAWPFWNYDFEDEYPSNTDLPPKILSAVLRENVDEREVHDYWLGRGQMYVWKRPDLFPVDEAYASIRPLYVRDNEISSTTPQKASLTGVSAEIILSVARYLTMREALGLLLLNYSLRSKLLPLVDALAKEQLPGWAFPTEHEQPSWNQLVSTAATDSSSVYTVDGVHFPWLSYARACAHSPSMQNRRRIHGICQQIRKLAERHNIIV